MISLRKVGLEEAELIHQMQVEAFQPLLEKYQDFETNPAAEPVERIIFRLKQAETDFYLIEQSGNLVSAVDW